MSILAIHTVCHDLSPYLQLIGQALNVFKILLPLILVILGVFDIGKAVISSKSDDVKKHMKNFVKKIIACVVVFFIPTICMVIFGFVGSFNDIKNDSGIDFDVCYDCMFKPSGKTCTNAIEDKYEEK